MAGREKGSTTPPAHPPPGGTGLAPLPAKKMRFFLLFLVVGFAGEATSFFSVFFFGFFLLLRVVPGPPMAVTNEPVETRESPFLVVHAQNSETVGFSRILTKHLNSKPNKEMAVRRIPFSKKKTVHILGIMFRDVLYILIIRSMGIISIYISWSLYNRYIRYFDTVEFLNKTKTVPRGHALEKDSGKHFFSFFLRNGATFFFRLVVVD